MLKVGFMGLGDQGKYMAMSLLQKNGEMYVGYTPGHAEANTAELVSMGAKRVSPAELGKVCDIIFLCLTNGPIDGEAIFGEGGIASGATPGTLIVDHCSMEAERACDYYDRLQKMGVHYLECPVSGGASNAKAGTMIFIAAGDEDDYKRAVPYFEMMGKNMTYLGKAGNASIAKLASQIILVGNSAALMEAMTFAAKMGLDPEKVYEAIRTGLAGSAVMEFYFPRILVDPEVPSGNFKVLYKDIRNALITADGVNCPMPIMANVHAIIRRMMNNGRNSKLDWTSFINYWEEGAGVKVRAKEDK